MKKVVPFAKARETSLYGSKAVGLGEAVRQGITVPPGVALSGDLVDAIASGEEEAIAEVEEAVADLKPPFAVRSSAVDEDGVNASFAGQHLTVLNVHSVDDVPDAVAIDEAVGLAKRYCQADAGKFVNGILGAIVRREVRG